MPDAKFFEDDVQDLDQALDAVTSALLSIDDAVRRIGSAVRRSYDQIYNGQYTGRFKWDQLAKVEKTHFGSLVEINIQRELGIVDGRRLDFHIGGSDVDCKYSQRDGGWMIPPEAIDQICMVLKADDRTARWGLGLIRCSPDALNKGSNRDAKKTISRAGRDRIIWVWDDEQFPENVLVTLPDDEILRIMSPRSGAQRLDQLFRTVQERRITRGTVATVAQQQDYMKRARANGGSRSRLRAEGILVLGDSQNHQDLAEGLGVTSPQRGEFVAVAVAEAAISGPGVVEIDAGLWRRALADDLVSPAPELPNKSTAAARDQQVVG